MKTQTTFLEKKIGREKIIQELSPLSKQILELVKHHGNLSISDLELLTGANRNTIKVRLRELVRDLYLDQHGQGKGTRYALGKKIE